MVLLRGVWLIQFLLLFFLTDHFIIMMTIEEVFDIVVLVLCFNTLKVGYPTTEPRTLSSFRGDVFERIVKP